MRAGRPTDEPRGDVRRLLVQRQVGAGGDEQRRERGREVAGRVQRVGERRVAAGEQRQPVAEVLVLPVERGTTDGDHQLAEQEKPANVLGHAHAYRQIVHRRPGNFG